MRIYELDLMRLKKEKRGKSNEPEEMNSTENANQTKESNLTADLLLDEITVLDGFYSYNYRNLLTNYRYLIKPFRFRRTEDSPIESSLYRLAPALLISEIS